MWCCWSRATRASLSRTEWTLRVAPGATASRWPVTSESRTTTSWPVRTSCSVGDAADVAGAAGDEDRSCAASQPIEERATRLRRHIGRGERPGRAVGHDRPQRSALRGAHVRAVHGLARGRPGSLRAAPPCAVPCRSPGRCAALATASSWAARSSPSASAQRARPTTAMALPGSSATTRAYMPRACSTWSTVRSRSACSKLLDHLSRLLHPRLVGPARGRPGRGRRGSGRPASAASPGG